MLASRGGHTISMRDGSSDVCSPALLVAGPEKVRLSPASPTSPAVTCPVRVPAPIAVSSPVLTLKLLAVGPGSFTVTSTVATAVEVLPWLSLTVHAYVSHALSTHGCVLQLATLVGS